MDGARHCRADHGSLLLERDVRKELGKIKSARFGYGGYQECQFGLSVDMGGEGWGVGNFKGFWATSSEGTKWTESDRSNAYAETMRFLKDLLDDAEVTSVDQLKGKPVEVEFDGNMLKDWRILKEVL
jgi:hypothetical protein